MIFALLLAGLSFAAHPQKQPALLTQCLTVKFVGGGGGGGLKKKEKKERKVLLRELTRGNKREQRDSC